MATHATHLRRRWTPGRWFGVALLGFLVCVASTIAYGAVDSTTGVILALPLLLGLAALVVGLVGAAVALIRGQR